MDRLVMKCPVCGKGLERDEKQYRCPENHSFDISGKGYVNLLLANQKKTSDPGDNKAMMESRGEFLEKGYYDFFYDKLIELISKRLAGNSINILDAGCGEGYLLSRLKCRLSQVYGDKISYFGIDISKSAVKYAVKRDSGITLAVGSNFNLPFMSESMDIVIRNFAPGDHNEFFRILKPGGSLVIVTPGIEHLFGLKEILYSKARKNEIKTTELNGFKHAENLEIRYNMHLVNPEEIKNLISMTPYYWSIDDKMRAAVGNFNELETELDFIVDVYEK